MRGRERTQIIPKETPLFHFSGSVGWIAHILIINHCVHLFLRTSVREAGLFAQPHPYHQTSTNTHSVGAITNSPAEIVSASKFGN